MFVSGVTLACVDTPHNGEGQGEHLWRIQYSCSCCSIPGTLKTYHGDYDRPVIPPEILRQLRSGINAETEDQHREGAEDPCEGIEHRRPVHIPGDGFRGLRWHHGHPEKHLSRVLIDPD